MNVRAVTVRRLIPALVGVLSFALLSLLYLSGHRVAYDRIIGSLGITVWPYPFLDTDTVLSAVRCLNRGIDAYVVNPCDPLRRQFDYSPMWMVLRIFPMTPAWLSPVGLAVDLAFIASLLLLPPARDSGSTFIIVAGVLSSGTSFAVERGNNDLVLFTLVSFGAVLALRTQGLRLLGYALVLLAGLLKYYPLAAMTVVCREKLPRFVWIAVASILFTAMFVLITWHDLIKALSIIPTGDYWGDMFGSEIVANRAADQLFHSSLARSLIRGTMTIGSLAISLRFGTRVRMQQAVDSLTKHERSFLLVGTMMIAGCFFTAQNIGYRVVHLLLVLPSLLALARGPNSRVFALVAASALALLWSIWWRNLVLTPPVSYLTWTAREGMWWFTVTMLDACAVGLVWQSPTMAGLLGLTGRQREGVA